MRLTLATLCTFISLLLSGQQENSLLWEISGNGLQEPSYLYGTMHVSKKIAFHLDDVFYEALENSDVVALESDPATWLGSDIAERGSMPFGFESKGFYRDAFQFSETRKKDVARLIATDEGLINGILYRTNEYSQNFEEDTYLDMFIYRAGRKQGKKVIALEDLEESRTLVALASRNAMKKKPDAWLQERMEREDLMSLMQDAYRSRNISLLDSIDKAMYTDHYLENMLYIRNRNMARKLDSAMGEQRIFAGIGAAHLPGDEGVIAMLRRKGYTVTPLTSVASDTGKKIKSEIEALFREPSLKTRSPEDKTFSIDLPSDLHPVNEATHTTYLAPDLTNGAYFLAHRIPTFQFLPGRSAITLEDIDALLFENIPGRTLEKNPLQIKGYEGIEVLNMLKNGDRQRYQIFLTPLELFIFKLAGKGDYVTRYGDAIFHSLDLAKENGQPLLKSYFGEFQVQATGLFRYPNPSRTGNRHLEGIDPDGGYYFMRKITLNDLDLLEEDNFELRQIQKRFYESLGLTGEFGHFKGRSLSSSAPVPGGDSRLYLKTVIQANHYYLLGYLGADKSKARSFLKSFKAGLPVYPDAFETIRDTAMYFTTVSPVAPEKFVEKKSPRRQGNSGAADYEPFTKQTVYQYQNNEAILVNVRKSHDLAMSVSLDSLWHERKTTYIGGEFKLVKEEMTEDAKGNPTMVLKLRDTASSRAFLIKNVLRGGLLYELRTIVDLKTPQTRFVKEFYSNFMPADTVIGRSPLEDKMKEFLLGLSRGDSVATEGYAHVRVNKNDAPLIMNYLDTVKYQPHIDPVKTHLLKELSRVDEPDVRDFLNKTFAESFSDGVAQARIAQAVSKKANRDAALNLLRLLEEDLPLVSGEHEIEAIFEPFHNKPELTEYLFPSLLEYHAIEEYKTEVIRLLAVGFEQEIISPDTLGTYREILLTDAGMQLKRLLAFEAKAKRKLSRKHRQTRELLQAYLPILFEIREDPLVQKLFDRIPLLEDAHVTSTYLALSAREGLQIDTSEIEKLARDMNSRILFYEALEKVGQTEILPADFRNQQSIAEAQIFRDQHFDPNSDFVEFVAKTSLEKDGKKYDAYFLKARNGLSYHPNPKMYLLVYPEGTVTTGEPHYQSEGWLILDTRTDEEVMAFLQEQFSLSEHPRAVVYEPGQQNPYSDFGF